MALSLHHEGQKQGARPPPPSSGEKAQGGAPEETTRPLTGPGRTCCPGPPPPGLLAALDLCSRGCGEVRKPRMRQSTLWAGLGFAKQTFKTPPLVLFIRELRSYPLSPLPERLSALLILHAPLRAHSGKIPPPVPMETRKAMSTHRRRPQCCGGCSAGAWRRPAPPLPTRPGAVAMGSAPRPRRTPRRSRRLRTGPARAARRCACAVGPPGSCVGARPAKQMAPGGSRRGPAACLERLRRGSGWHRGARRHLLCPGSGLTNPADRWTALLRV